MTDATSDTGGLRARCARDALRRLADTAEVSFAGGDAVCRLGCGTVVVIPAREIERSLIARLGGDEEAVALMRAAMESLRGEW